MSFIEIAETASFSTDLQEGAEAYAKQKKDNGYEVTIDFDYNAWQVRSEYTVMFDKVGDAE